MPSQADKRNAMPAVTPVLPFSALDKVTRDSFKFVAACVAVMVSGIHSRNTSPGCAGLCILLTHAMFSAPHPVPVAQS